MEITMYSPWMLERIAIGDTVRLRFGTSTMGRHSSSNIRVLDASFISRHHAIFEVADDERISIKDVSSNGIYVNDTKYEKTSVNLKNNDLIGIGVSPINHPEDINIIKLPIYQLKYVPLKKFQLPNATNYLAKPSSKPEFELNNPEAVKKETYNKNNGDSQLPSCSKSVKVETVNNMHEIFEISDDDECDMKGKQVAKEVKSNENQEKLVSHLNEHIDTVIKNEHYDNNNYINPSQKSQERKLDDVILNEDSQRSLNGNSNKKDVNDEKEENSSKSKESLDALNNGECKQPVIHVPIISKIKKERLRTVSADIQNIFGDIEDDDEIQKTIKEINPFVYKEIHVSKNFKSLNDQENILSNGDFINLTNNEDLEDIEIEEVGTIIPNPENNKSTAKEEPNKKSEVEKLVSVFPEKDATECKEKDSSVMEKPKIPNIFDSYSDNNSNVQKITNNGGNVDLDEYTKYVPTSDDEDIEDLMFSQVIINDMKAEFQADLNTRENFSLSNSNTDNHILASASNVGKTVVVKQEPGLELFSAIPKELENSCWIISDDEDYDEELETKVNDWSNKISQSFSLLSQNMSQIYEIEESDKNDNNDEDDCFEEGNVSLLEDDIEGTANIYNRIEDLNMFDDLNKKPAQQDTHNVSKTDDIGMLEEKPDRKELEKIENEDINQKTNMTEEKSPATVGEKNDDIHYPNKTNMQEEKPDCMDLEKVANLDIEMKVNITKEKSPLIEVGESNDDTQSPIVRTRRLSKTNPVIETPSSSEDEIDMKIIRLCNDVIATDVDTPFKKLLPPVIDAPKLPKHKGKLRGVSAEFSKKTSSVNKTLNSVKHKLHQEYYIKDLKRKWLEKPSIAKKRDKEHKKYIKECRKDKLKELAERKKSPSEESHKRKLSAEGHEHKSKVAKVKVTNHNRGAFLANNDLTPVPPPPAANGHKTEHTNQFKIPKVTKMADDAKKTNNLDSNKKCTFTRSHSVDCYETFSQQISKPDDILLKCQNIENKKDSKLNHMNKIHNTAPLRRNSTAEMHKHPVPSNAICKEAIAARAVRTTNKITFASMEKNIEESEECKRKLSELSAKSQTVLQPISCIKKTSVKKKTVRFNETPVIHYIERVTGACKKINYKDVLQTLSVYKDRRHSNINKFPIVNHTNEIISDILRWSNEWLKKRNAAVEAAGDVVYPMPTQFGSFEHYKSIIFPLMQLEFLSTLEREYNVNQNVKKFKVSLEYATHNEDRIMLVTKIFNNQNKEIMDSCLYDLVLLEADIRGPQIFAFLVSSRKGAGTCGTIVYEIITKNFTIDYIRAIKEFSVRPVMDKVRLHFGAFNAVYQLQSTPLFQKIINPLELLKSRPPPKRVVIYRGFDKLNDKQRQVLLNTYVKIIDESTPNITLIQGPPGTGKSCVITNLVLQTLYGDEVRYLDKKILICAQGNAAVDVIAAKLYDISLRMRPEKRFRLIRYGMINKMHPSVLPIALQKVVEHDQLKKLQARNKNMHIENKENLKSQILQFEAQVAEMSSRNIQGTVEEDVLIEKKRQLQLMRNILNENMRPEDECSLFSWYLCNANVVCATLSSCVNLSQYIDFFDICIIDEATQCTEPWTLLPLKFCINSLVLVGDTQQLPATVLSKKANELGLGTSLFTRIQHCLDSIPCTSIKGSKALFTTPNNIMHCLQTQYRMHPEICRWPNQYFYRNELINDKSTIDFNKTPLVPFSVLSLTYTQNNFSLNGKITNNLEAEFVAKLLKALDGFIPNRYNSYGVITPYAQHRVTLESSIRNLGLTNIMVNTIDSYQGLEKDVIVISNARTNGIGFLCNPQRLNVALTRAKKCLILCGNFKNLESVPAWRSLLENARERKLYHEISANCIEDIHTNVIDKIKLKNQNQ